MPVTIHHNLFADSKWQRRTYCSNRKLWCCPRSFILQAEYTGSLESFVVIQGHTSSSISQNSLPLRALETNVTLHYVQVCVRKLETKAAPSWKQLINFIPAPWVTCVWLLPVCDRYTQGKEWFYLSLGFFPHLTCLSHLCKVLSLRSTTLCPSYRLNC